MTRRKSLALAVLCVAQFVEVLGVTVAIVALPSIGRDLDAGPTTVQWVVTAYALTFGGLLLAAGRAADRFGRRRLFVAGLLGFALASLACGLAPSAPVLLAARAVQGVAAAAVVPAALALLTATFDGDADLRTRALAVWTAAAAGGGAAGFLVGGVVTGALGWRWVFLLNVPVALAAAALAPRVLDESRDRERRGRVLETVRRRGVLEACGIAATLTATTGGAAVLVTAYLQDVLGHSPAATGLLFLPFSVAVVLGSLLGPSRAAPLGLGVVAAGTLLYLLTTSDGGLAAVVAALAVSGAGLGFASVAATDRGMTAAGAAEQGAAAGVLNTATQLGTAAGTALIGTVAAVRSGVDGLHVGWAVAAALAGVAALLAAWSLRTGASRAPVRQRSGA